MSKSMFKSMLELIPLPELMSESKSEFIFKSMPELNSMFEPLSCFRAWTVDARRQMECS